MRSFLSLRKIILGVDLSSVIVDSMLKMAIISLNFIYLHPDLIRKSPTVLGGG
tara:strand:+ start:145 stop:303 length:159 start_codon:yes stop_codon:yes gene_type:complete